MPNFIRGIAHTAYVVSDMKAALEFYEGALGFEKAFELSDDRGNPWIVYLGVGDDQFIELFYSAPGSEKAKGQIGANHLCLLTDNIEEAARHLRDGGYPLTPRFPAARTEISNAGRMTPTATARDNAVRRRFAADEIHKKQKS